MDGLKNRQRVEQKKKLNPVEVNHEEGVAYVLSTEVPIVEAGPHTPKPDKFSHFALDSKTLAVIEKAATAVELRQPCLLEGETAASKTSSIEYLAMITGHEVIRLNLNGQADTSDLIGKYVPNDGSLLIKLDELVRNVERLTRESQEIVTNARAEGRGLSLLESQKLAKLEDLDIQAWKWQDGKIPEAMKKGQWVILDEINLAEPQILERLNPLLERSPSLTITEKDGEVIRDLTEAEEEEWSVSPKAGTERLDEKFRIFATMNPAEYAGRSAMSPAYKDRWTSYKYVESPGESEYLNMLQLMVHGLQPIVIHEGIEYAGAEVSPLYEGLSNVAGVEALLPRLAKFQAILEQLAKKLEIGKGLKEPYIFTRRGLMEFLNFLANKSVLDRQNGGRVTFADDPKMLIRKALQSVYLDRIRSQDDLTKINDQLDAMGMGPNQWTIRLGQDAIPVANVSSDTKNGTEKAKETEKKVYRTPYGGLIKIDESMHEKGGYKVGQKLKAISASLIPEVREAKTIEVVGFKSSGEIVICINGDPDKCYAGALGGMSKDYTKVEEVAVEAEKEKEVEKKVYKGALTGAKFRIAEGVEIMGRYKVGQKLKVASSKLIPEIKEAKTIEVVGFTVDGQIVTSINGDPDKCFANSPDITDELYSKVELLEGRDPKELLDEFISQTCRHVSAYRTKEVADEKWTWSYGGGQYIDMHADSGWTDMVMVDEKVDPTRWSGDRKIGIPKLLELLKGRKVILVRNKNISTEKNNVLLKIVG